MANALTPSLAQLALAEMHRRDEEAGIDPMAIEIAPSPPAPAMRVLPPLIPPWDDPADTSFVRTPEPPQVVATEEIPSDRPPPQRVAIDAPPVEWHSSQMRAAS